MLRTLSCSRVPTPDILLKITRRGSGGWWRKPYNRDKGFSLTEVAVALAVVGFAVVTLIGLLPTSLESFRAAVDTTVTAQISQRIISEVQETDFDLLIDNDRNGAEEKTIEFSRLPIRYYDDQGNELRDEEKRAAIYHAVIRVSQPGRLDPSQHDSNWFTSLPSTGSRFNPRDMTIVTVEIVANRDVRELPLDATTLLLDQGEAKAQHLSYRTYSAIIARNGYLAKRS